ncbi:MAG: PAS domain-containing protein [Cyanobacteria bacterium J06638_22]
MNSGWRLSRWVDSGAKWLLAWLAGEVSRWIATKQEEVTSRQWDYVEGMMAEYEQLLQQWHKQGMSDATILLRLCPKSLDALQGICYLAIDRYVEAIRLFLHANNEFLLLLESIDVSPISTLRLKKLFRWLHYLTGNIRYPIPKVRIRLSPCTQVTYWDAKAKETFGWTEQDALGKSAVGLFVPWIESGSERIMTSHLEDVCQFRDDFSLNVNQNQNAEGQLFWMFWVNVPVTDSTGKITELLSVGMRTDEPELMHRMVKLWRKWRRFRRTVWVMRHYLRKAKKYGLKYLE